MSDTALTAGTAAIPPSLTTWLGPLSWAVVLLTLVWALAWAFDHWKRKRYNLTSAGQAEPRGRQPDFLRIDREKRAAQIARGEAYRRAHEGQSEDDTGGDEEAVQEPSPSPWLRILRIVVVVAALANVVSVTAGALLRIESTHAFFMSLTDLERWVALVREYWIGFLVAVGVILGQLYRFGTLVLQPQERKKRRDDSRGDLDDDRNGIDASDGGGGNGD